jgi:hypothetical protein
VRKMRHFVQTGSRDVITVFFGAMPMHHVGTQMDRVAILDLGRAIAAGGPSDTGRTRVDVEFEVRGADSPFLGAAHPTNTTIVPNWGACLLSYVAPSLDRLSLGQFVARAAMTQLLSHQVCSP